MKMVDRHTCEGTTPRIVIGHRVSKVANGVEKVSRTWTAQWSFQGKAYYESLGTKNKVAALRKAQAIHLRIHAGEVKPKKFSLSLQELGEGYIQLKQNEDRAPGTLEVYRNSWRVVMEWAVERRKTSAVTFTENDFWSLNAWLQERGDSESTRYHRLILVKQAFKWSVREKLLGDNPVLRPSLRKPTHAPQPCFTPDQVSQLLAAAQTTCPENVPVFAALAYLGLRSGEARDLQWQDLTPAPGSPGIPGSPGSPGIYNPAPGSLDSPGNTSRDSGASGGNSGGGGGGDSGGAAWGIDGIDQEPS